MNILILIILLIIFGYISKINNKKNMKDCPECKKYRLFTKMRLIHLNTLNFNFKNKTVLEIGAKDTSFSRYFISEKAKVTRAKNKQAKKEAEIQKLMEELKSSNFTNEIKK